MGLAKQAAQYAPQGVDSPGGYDKPAFRDSFRARRCLVPASGFYEWARTGIRKQPYHFQRRDGQPLAFAGLWDRWHGLGRDMGRDILTCCILTTDGNDVVRPIHDRMPVVLLPAEFDAWLAPASDPADVAALMHSYLADELQAAAVSTLVNSPKIEGPGLLRLTPRRMK